MFNTIRISFGIVFTESNDTSAKLNNRFLWGKTLAQIQNKKNLKTPYNSPISLRLDSSTQWAAVTMVRPPNKIDHH